MEALLLFLSEVLVELYAGVLQDLFEESRVVHGPGQNEGALDGSHGLQSEYPALFLSRSRLRALT